MSEFVFCLMGPTASGKTSLACELVECFPFEIISVDSAMIYRGMDIGTAKPDGSILARSPHHLIDVLDPSETYSAALFCEDVKRLSLSIRERNKIPLLVGGTMMYFRALQQGLSLLPQGDEQIREALLRQAQQKGWGYLHDKLASIDPPSAARIHPNDTQRIQRALEIYEMTGKPWSDFLGAESFSYKVTTHPVNQNFGELSLDKNRFVNLILMPKQRQWLHQRIAWRFERMLMLGLIDEVKSLVERWQLTVDHPSMRSVGYRQVLAYLQGQYDDSTLCTKGIVATRRLAKRQLTWLRHWPEGYVFKAEKTEVLAEIMAIIRKILDNNPG